MPKLRASDFFRSVRVAGKTRRVKAVVLVHHVPKQHASECIGLIRCIGQGHRENQGSYYRGLNNYRYYFGGSLLSL